MSHKLFHGIATALTLALTLDAAGCGRATQTDATDISGVMPRLAFHLTRASDGTRITAEDYRGKVVVLYFGYTHCPDECPTTLANLASALVRLGDGARNVRVAFVTVDPIRDTLPVLKSYVNAFSPEIDGLRGSDDAVATLARRYRVIYSVTPGTPGHAYAVMHSDSVFFFDAKGNARLVTMETGNTADIAARIASLSRQDFAAKATVR
jgi:protein SCO1/2